MLIAGYAWVEGVTLPFWPELQALCLDMHRTLTRRTLIGWDVAVTADGPVMVEANGKSGPSVKDMVLIDGFFGRPVARLMCGHLHRILQATEPEGSRRRFTSA